MIVMLSKHKANIFLPSLIPVMVEEWVVLGPHEYLLEKADLEDLERKVYELIRREGKLPVSKIWRVSSCHLWELDAVLKRLKDKGLVIEEQ